MVNTHQRTIDSSLCETVSFPSWANKSNRNRVARFCHYLGLDLEIILNQPQKRLYIRKFHFHPLIHMHIIAIHATRIPISIPLAHGNYIGLLVEDHVDVTNENSDYLKKKLKN